MNKRNVLLFVFEGFADWEASYGLVGITKSNAYSVKTIALEKAPIKSMGGVTIFPDLDFRPETDLKDLDSSNTALLILPGGVAWEEENSNPEIASLVLHCAENQIPVAAICGATVFLARLGLLNEREHTSNDLNYLKSLADEYCGTGLYRNEPSVFHRGIVTANGTAAIEFAENIFDLLEISACENVKQWFQYFQNKGVLLTRVQDY